MTTIARNAPCPCGSGKRFKDCHGTPRATGAESPTTDSLLRDARAAVALGRPNDALAFLRQALALEPDRADLLRERARLEWTLGAPEAVASCRAALAREPDDVLALNLLGEMLSAIDADAAERSWRRALELDPGNAEALFHLANRLREDGEADPAIELYQRALERAPGHAGILNNLGLALEARGDAEQAEACYRRILDKESQHAEALANLAVLLKSAKRYHEALPWFEQALRQRRDFPARFWISRGVTLGELHAYADAEASLREAARIEPDHAPTQVDIGSMCIVQDKFDEAEGPLVRALELDPGNPYVATMLVYARLNRCAWGGLDAAFAEIDRYVASDKPRRAYNAVPFPLLAMPLGPATELRAAKAWARQIEQSVAGARQPAVRASHPASGRLRVGFVSSDFREHPVAHLAVECWERIDRTRTETFAYSLVPEDATAFGQRVVRAFDRYADVSSETTERIARRIVDDGIDILIDLNGYTTHSRSELFALKPAPVQVSWLGYLGTMGSPAYDYVLTDRFAAPPELQPFFTERFLYLPDCYCPSDGRRPVAAATPTRDECRLPERGFVFCCFNNAYKILPPVFGAWMRLLSQVPDSVLWLSPANASARANLRREAEIRCVAPERLVFAPRVPLGEHL
ncbi:MAG TPA: tetratricopeptide repeat protein, partial [Casimicrobiaceae bacterium]|nr:tetratricopeptide repeat protein [Casimicrobiaceae bacterium]